MSLCHFIYLQHVLTKLSKLFFFIVVVHRVPAFSARVENQPVEGNVHTPASVMPQNKAAG